MSFGIFLAWLGPNCLAYDAMQTHSAMQVACKIRAEVQRDLGLTMSFGIAVGKLAARLAGPLHKPSGLTVVPPQQAAALLLGTPILKVPQLRYRCWPIKLAD